MPFVITDICKGCKDTSCISVCPCDCIHPTPEEHDFEAADQLYIDPSICIDCALCAHECPVGAIFAEEDLPEDKLQFTQINETYFRNRSS